jgi:hypothetical protein
MFISIDMDKQRFLHKHADHETVSKLAWLECGQQVSIRIDNIEADNFLHGVAHGDLCHLYQNTTSDSFQEFEWGERAFQFRERLREAARNMPQTVALIEEVDAQVAAVDDRLHAGERFKYALGAKVPAQADELFPLPFVPLIPPQTKAADARAAEQRRQFQERLEAEKRGDFLPPSARANAGLPPLPGAPVSAPTAPEAAPPAPKPAKARSGSVQPVVFAAAEAAWNDPARVASGESWADVKARLFKQLSDDGHHPTTVRIKLSKWAKEKGL